MALIVVGGIQHETNTFAPTKAGLEAFQVGGSRPSLTTGPDLFPRIKGKNLPIAGFVERIEALDHFTHALTWGTAAPSALCCSPKRRDVTNSTKAIAAKVRPIFLAESGDM